MSKDREWLMALLTDISDTRQQWETSSGEPMHKDAKDALKYIEQLEKKAARYEWLRKYNFNNRWTDEEIDREIERDKIIADTALSHTK